MAPTEARAGLIAFVCLRQVIFYGHKPLHFRAATQGDAELWIMALEYAKEFTWHLWP